MKQEDIREHVNKELAEERVFFDLENSFLVKNGKQLEEDHIRIALKQEKLQTELQKKTDHLGLLKTQYKDNLEKYEKTLREKRTEANKKFQ